MMRRFLFVLASVFAWVGIAGQANASGFPGHLDEFCRTAEYIVVAECVEHTDTRAKLRVETVYKAPQTNPKPDFLDVKGFPSTATRFSFKQGQRYFAFVFEDGRCDAQGSHFAITEDGRLARAVRELICLEENTDTLDQLTRQVKRVLSGEYENELIARIGSKELSYFARRTDALALSRTNPKAAVEPLAALLLEISQAPVVDGSSREVYVKLLALAPDRARDLSLEILSNTDSFRLFVEAAYVLAQPQCRIEDFQEHYAMLVRAADRWEEWNPGSGYAQMLPVFINNGCRAPEVKRMLLAALSTPGELGYFDLVSQSTIKLQFPESLPLFWNHIKKRRLVSDLVNLDRLIASHVGAGTVYARENYERLEVWMGKNLIRRRFPEYAKSLVDAEAVRVDKSLLFLITPDDGKGQTCLYVGFVRRGQNRFEHRVFVLFGHE